MKLYSIESYDKEFNLKLSLGSAFWLAFLCRSILIIPTHLYLESRSVDVADFFYATDFQFMASVVSALPALVIFAAWIRRHPSAGSLPRLVWANGKSLLILSATLNLFVIIWSVADRKLVSNFDLVQTVVSFYCLFYVIRSERMRDTFKSFPELPDS